MRRTAPLVWSREMQVALQKKSMPTCSASILEDYRLSAPMLGTASASSHSRIGITRYSSERAKTRTGRTQR
jgi:hypothetical protein